MKKKCSSEHEVFTVLRAAFGVALFASVAVIYSAIIAISVSGSDREREDRRRSDFGGGFGGGFGFGPSLYYGPSRLAPRALKGTLAPLGPL